MLKLNDFRDSFENDTILTEKATSFDILRNGEEIIPSLIFTCEGFTFYLPYTEFFADLNTDADIDRYSYLLYKHLGADISFLVTSLDDNMKLGVVSKVAADSLSQINKLSPRAQQQVKEGDIVDFSVLLVTDRNIALNGCGVTTVLNRSSFPEIANQKLDLVFNKNDKISCEIIKINPPQVKGKGFELEIKPLNYPKADAVALNEGSYHLGKIIRVSKKYVQVEFEGNLISCQAPFSGVPLEGASTIVQITKAKDPQNKFYFGKLLSCETPVLRQGGVH